MDIKFKLHNKLNLILELLCENSYDKLTDYFLDERKTNHDNRKKHIKKLIRDRVSSYSKNFREDYNRYKISSIFTLDEFINSSEDKFSKIIGEYIKLRYKANSSTLYPYMYIFDREHKEKIYSYQINYKCQEKGRIQKITMNSLETDDINEEYIGEMIYHHNGSVSFIIKNDISTIHILIQNDLDTHSFKYLYGVYMGEAHKNQKILIAKKVILSKEQIEYQEYKNLYLSLNEIEIISTVESFHHADDRSDIFTHLEKYSLKLEDYNNLFNNLTTKQELQNDFYLQLAFKEFYGTSKLINKLSTQKQYFTLNRTNILETVFKILNDDTALYMVMPIFDSDNIFVKETTKANQLRERFLTLKKAKIIFIIDSNRNIDDFQYIFEEMSKLNSIKFALKDEVENSVNSLDFFYTNKKDFVATRKLRTDKQAFYISKERDTIDEHEIFYKKIDKMSISYQEFSKNSFSIFSKEMKSILGEWYVYRYGDYIHENGERKLWESILKINSANRVENFRRDGKERVANGEITVTKKQIIINLISLSTGNSKIIYFNKDKKIYPIIQLFFIDKRFARDDDMLSVGILSKQKLTTQKAREILGEDKLLIFTPPVSLKERIDEVNINISGHYKK